MSEDPKKNLAFSGLSVHGLVRDFDLTEEITVLSESDDSVIYVKKQTRGPKGGPVIGPYCKRCVMDPKSGIEVCVPIDCPTIVTV